MNTETIQTGWAMVSSGVTDRSTHRCKKSYTRLFQTKKSRDDKCLGILCAHDPEDF